MLIMFTKLLGFTILMMVGSMDSMTAQESLWEQRLGPAQIAVNEPGYHVWGSSPVIGPEGKTHLFVARWTIDAGFLPGWHTDCEVAHYVGEGAEGPFVFQDVALEGTGLGTDIAIQVLLHGRIGPTLLGRHTCESFMMLIRRQILFGGLHRRVWSIVLRA
ncbi:MAG: hypothetical protein GY747_08635 [Planctomycetes bacterium]|nr:hypothetical protein [Planctomycetota bacterium]